MKRTIPVLVVVGLAIVLALLLINRDDDGPPDTLADATTTTSDVTTTVPETTTTTSTGTSTTAATEVEVVETVEEAEAILRELWFGWFEGIYNEDEDRIREVVATEAMLRAGIAAFGELEFGAAPTASEIRFSETDLLLSSNDCLAIWAATEAPFVSAETRTGVDILRQVDGEWRFASSWQSRDDLWETDCEAELLPLP